MGNLNRHTNGTPLTDMRTVLGSRLRTTANLSRDHLGRIDHVIRDCSNVPVPPGHPVAKSDIFARITKMRTSNSGGTGLCYGSLLPRHFKHGQRCTLNGGDKGTGVLHGLRRLKLRLSPRRAHGIARHVVRLNSGGRLIARRSLPCVMSSILGRSAPRSRMHLVDCVIAATCNLGPVTSIGLRVGKRTCRRGTYNSNRFSTFVHTTHRVCESGLGHGFP